MSTERVYTSMMARKGWCPALWLSALLDSAVRDAVLGDLIGSGSHHRQRNPEWARIVCLPQD